MVARVGAARRSGGDKAARGMQRSVRATEGIQEGKRELTEIVGGRARRDTRKGAVNATKDILRECETGKMMAWVMGTLVSVD